MSKAGKLRVDVAAWGLVIHAGTRAIQIVLEAQAMASAVGQAVLVEWGTSRLGVTWSDPDAPATTAAVAKRAGLGALIGAALAALVFAVLLATRAVRVERVASVELSVLALGLLGAVLQAWRDELLHHGVVLRVLRDTPVSPAVRVLACGVTSAGAALGRSDATPRTMFVALLLGVVSGALWVRDRGAWLPCAARTATTFTATTLLAGGLVQARVGDDAWAGGGSGMLGGTAAVVALAPVAVLALARVLRGAHGTASG